MCKVMALGGEVGIRSLSPCAPAIPSSVHRCVEYCLGCASVGLDCSRDMGKGKAGSIHQCIGNENSSTGFGCRPSLDDGGVHTLDEWQNYSTGIHKETRRHCL